MRGKIKFKLVIDGILLLSTEDENLYRQVQESVKGYLERYGKNGVQEHVEMILEEML